MLEDLHPSVDLRPISSATYVCLASGAVTGKQLAALSKCEIAIHDCRLPTTNEDKASLKYVMVIGEKRSQPLTEFLDAYVPDGLGRFYIQTDILEEDWDAIVRHQEKCLFNMNGSAPPDRIIDLSCRQSLKGITIYSTMGGDPTELRRIMRSSLNFTSILCDNEQQLWDLAVLRPSSNGYAWEQEDNTVAFKKKAKQRHWIFGKNERGDITHVWLPSVSYVRDNAKELIRVQTLRLDNEGVVANAYLEESDTDLRPLASLVNLKRLYLKRGQPLESLAFLKSLPTLEHLQIQSQVRSVMRGSGYRICSNLVSARFFGTLDPITISELSKLNKLKRIVVVDDDLTYQDTKEAETLRSKLPNVKIDIMHPNEFEPDVSERWKKHVERVREKTLQRLDKQIAAESSIDKTD